MIFVKGYRYQPQRDEKIKLEEPTIPNRNGFFDNLPTLSANELRKGGGFKLDRMSKKQRKQKQLERLEEQE